MKVIVIYHHPQECGSPYLTFISQLTGEVVETIDIPTGYYDSGMEIVENFTPIYSFTEQVNMTPMPTVDNVRISAPYYPNPRHYVFRVTKVDNIQEDNQVFRTWKADVHVDACEKEILWNYNPDKDEFLQKMTAAGFDLSNWDITRRMKTPLLEFLKDVLSSYKDYELLNLIEIN